MPPAPDQLPRVLSEITATLVDAPRADVVLSLVTNACAELLGTTATGVMLVDPRGGVRVVSASDEGARFIELLQSQTGQGPCVDSIRTGTTIGCPDLEQDLDRWPEFASAALRAGYRSVHSVPMTLDSRVVGGLNLFYSNATTLTTNEDRVARAVADLATLGLSQEQDPRRADRLAEQTLRAFNGRVEMAQAIGMVAGALQLEPSQARLVLIENARSRGVTPADIARAVTSGEVDPAGFTPTDEQG